MILKAFSLLDTKVGMFHPPFFMSHEQQAFRAVSDLANDLSTTVGRHPADYSLVLVGSFDDQAGVLTPCAPEQLGLAVSFVRKPVSSPLVDKEMV